VGELISVSSSRRSRAGRNRDLENRGQKRADFLHVFTYPAFGQAEFQCAVVRWCMSSSVTDRPTKQVSERKAVTISKSSQSLSDLQDPPTLTPLADSALMIPPVAEASWPQRSSQPLREEAGCFNETRVFMERKTEWTCSCQSRSYLSLLLDRECRHAKN